MYFSVARAYAYHRREGTARISCVYAPCTRYRERCVPAHDCMERSGCHYLLMVDADQITVVIRLVGRVGRRCYARWRGRAVCLHCGKRLARMGVRWRVRERLLFMRYRRTAALSDGRRAGKACSDWFGPPAVTTIPMHIQTSRQTACSRFATPSVWRDHRFRNATVAPPISPASRCLTTPPTPAAAAFLCLFHLATL